MGSVRRSGPDATLLLDLGDFEKMEGGRSEDDPARHRPRPVGKFHGIPIPRARKPPSTAMTSPVVKLRHELSVLRRHNKRPRFRPKDAAALASGAGSLEVGSLRQARSGQAASAGRAASKELILRLAEENPRWGYKRIHEYYEAAA
jgi:hypothetical protein